MIRRLALVPLLLATGCVPAEPEGQVLATIDGQEVTRREVAEQVRATGGSVLDAAAQARALDQVIDRKLLARAARAALVDRDPGHQIAVRRMEETMLVDRYLRQAMPPAPPPVWTAMAAYIQAHPWRYQRRYAALVAGDAGRRMIDSAALTPDVAARLAAAAPGASIELTAGETVMLVERLPLTLAPVDQQRDAMGQLVTARQQAFAAALTKRLRAGASIRR
ncbi:hypothetical protein ACNI3Q_13920 [Sphingomonas sp. FW199]|uniref:hypothetical protein n=1 Tax=Sphingomonas sp. FW199 TaxID=3400217 RepID=UPI003CEE5EA1